MSDIFLSYASIDRPRVKPFVEALLQQGWSVWWDRTILPGKTWDQIIEMALADAKCVIVLWSKDSVQSDWVRTEAEEARRRGILVPVLLDDVNIPLAFRRIQAANMADWSGVLPNAGFEQLAQAISGVLSSGKSARSTRLSFEAATHTKSTEPAPPPSSSEGLSTEPAHASPKVERQAKAVAAPKWKRWALLTPRNGRRGKIARVSFYILFVATAFYTIGIFDDGSGHFDWRAPAKDLGGVIGGYTLLLVLSAILWFLAYRSAADDPTSEEGAETVAAMEALRKQGS